MCDGNFERIDKQREIDLYVSSYGNALLREMMHYVIPISWGTCVNGEITIKSNASAFILNLGEQSFLVTAAHVYEGYLAAKACQNFVSYLGSMEFNFEDRLIHSLGSSLLDIATFQITDQEINTLNKHVTYLNFGSEITRAKENQGVIFAGFPGKERGLIRDTEYGYGLYVGLSPISSSSDRHFGCVFSRENWLDTFGNGLPPLGYNMGGMSGGPAFLFQICNGVLSWPLVGVISCASIELGEILLVQHICYIGRDGRLVCP